MFPQIVTEKTIESFWDIGSNILRLEWFEMLRDLNFALNILRNQLVFPLLNQPSFEADLVSGIAINGAADTPHKLQACGSDATVVVKICFGSKTHQLRDTQWNPLCKKWEIFHVNWLAEFLNQQSLALKQFPSISKLALNCNSGFSYRIYLSEYDPGPTPQFDDPVMTRLTYPWATIARRPNGPNHIHGEEWCIYFITYCGSISLGGVC